MQNQSTPTNIGYSNPPNQLPIYHFGFFLITHHTQAPTASCHTLHSVLPGFRFPPSTTQSKMLQQPNPMQTLNTQVRLILHSCALAASQHTLNAAQPSINQHTVSSLHYRPRTPVHRFLKRTTKYLLNHKMTLCSTFTPLDLPPTLAARLAVCKRIHCNKYRPLKSS